MDQLPRLGKRELICLLLFTCNYVVSVLKGFLLLWVLAMDYVILLWHSLSLPYIYFGLSRAMFRKFVTALPHLIDVRIWFLLNILRMKGQNLTKCCIHININTRSMLEFYL